MSPEKLRELIAPKLGLEDSGYVYNGLRWSAESLYEQAKKEECEPVDFQLEFFSFDGEGMFEQTERMADIAFHMRRAIESDTSIPIIVGPLGNVMDGFHRILKAVIMCEKIMCYRLSDLPEPEEVENE